MALSALIKGDSIADQVEKVLVDGIDFVRAVHVHFIQKMGVICDKPAGVPAGSVIIKPMIGNQTRNSR